MNKFHYGELKITVDRLGGKTKMSWMGQSADRNLSVRLDTYLGSLLDELKGSELLIEYDRLEYMNSSTIPLIIRFLNILNAGGIKTEIVYDSNQKWQCATFKALGTLATLMKNITIAEK